MGNKLKELINFPIARAFIIIFVLTIIGGAGWAIAQTQVPPDQPIEFPHNRHVGLGVQCLYCHPGAWKGKSSGIPTQSKCWGCHQQIEKQTPELEKLKEYVETGESIPWVPVAIVPDFVHYNHRPHIAAGLNCETCHGEMSEMTIAEQRVEMNMGWCLDCHIERAGENEELKTKLLDCTTCHY
ncbi:MAG: cytochrome C [Aliifodinibius sp.]|nr:cytochrome C [Fodinibius sp.]